MKFFLLPLLFIALSSCNTAKTDDKQSCHSTPSQLTVKHEFHSIIVDGFCDSADCVRVMDSLLEERKISWCWGFRTDSAFRLFYRPGKITKAEDDYLWKNHLGKFQRPSYNR